MDKGLMVTINSDDPAYFGGYVNRNYLAVSQALRLGREEIAAIVKKAAASRAKGEWIQGRAWDQTNWGGTFPTQEALTAGLVTESESAKS